MIRQRQARARRSGYTGSLNDQDHPSTPANPKAGILSAAKIALCLIERHAAHWQHGEDWRVTEAVEALRILVEWLKRT